MLGWQFYNRILEETTRNFTPLLIWVFIMKQLKDIETEEYNMEVYECECGFHVGIDYSYLEQVGSVVIKCPNESCNNEITVKAAHLR